MAEVSAPAAAAAGIKLFGATIAVVEGRELMMNKEETKEGEGDPTVEKRPEKIIPCPRCKSMETKFCYFNNYNVNQPRHFCKGCQRYWTAGGALRNVPVGAGRRKSKPPPPCGGRGFSTFDADAHHQFDFDHHHHGVVVDEWHHHMTPPPAAAAAQDDFQHIFPAKRRRNFTSSDSQPC